MAVMTVGGKALSDFNVFHDTSTVFKKAEKKYTKFSVPGRNGSLISTDINFENVTITYNCFIRNNFKERFEELIEYLSSFDGYVRIETSTEPEIYRMGIFKTAVSPDTGAFNHYGQFKLEFDCMPQQFLKVGEREFTVSPNTTVTLENPTKQSANPLVYVTGTGTFYINGEPIQVNVNSGYLVLDFENFECYENNNGVITNRNLNVNIPSDFKPLNPGSNTIKTTNQTLRIVPRWWQL